MNGAAITHGFVYRGTQGRVLIERAFFEVLVNARKALINDATGAQIHVPDF